MMNNRRYRKMTEQEKIDGHKYRFGIPKYLTKGVRLRDKATLEIWIIDQLGSKRRRHGTNYVGGKPTKFRDYGPTPFILVNENDPELVMTVDMEDDSNDWVVLSMYFEAAEISSDGRLWIGSGI